MEYVFEYTVSVITFIQAPVDSRHPEPYKYHEKVEPNNPIKMKYYSTDSNLCDLTQHRDRSH